MILDGENLKGAGHDVGDTKLNSTVLGSDLSQAQAEPFSMSSRAMKSHCFSFTCNSVTLE